MVGSMSECEDGQISITDVQLYSYDYGYVK